MAEYGGKPVPVASSTPDSISPLELMLRDIASTTGEQLKGAVRSGLKAANTKGIDVSGVTGAQMMQNARNLMPKVLLDFVDQLATPEGPDLSVYPTSDAGEQPAPEKQWPIGTMPASLILGKGPDPALQGSSPAASDPALQMLQNETAALSDQALNKVEQAEQTATAIDTTLQVRDHLANTKFNDELLSLVGPDRIVVQRLPKGSKNTARSPGVETTLDPKTGELLVHVPQTAFQEAARVQQNDTKVAAQVVENSRVDTGVKFDVDKEMSKLKGLTGDAFTTGLTQLMVNIDMQLAKEYGRIRNQAAIESGYQEAQASLQKNLELDAGSGFTARFNQASAQTQAAQALLNKSLSASQALETSLRKADPEVARLVAAKNTLMKLETKREARESRKDDLRDTVTAQELTNYHFIYGSSGNDDQDRDTIVARRDKDPVMKKILKMDSTNAFALLTDPSADIRQKAGKLVNEYDKAANGLSPDQDSVVYTKIKPFLDNPLTLIDAAPIPKEQKARLRLELQKATGKELETLKQGIHSNLLAAVVQDAFIQSYGNMRGWKGDAAVDGPLKQIIDRVSKTNPTGAAPLDTVTRTFIYEKIPGPNGTNLPYKEKLNILQRALNSAVSSESKSLLLSDPSIINIKVGAKIRDITSRAAFATTLGGEVLDPSNSNFFAIAPWGIR